MDLACGPCEEVVDIFTAPGQPDLSRVEYHCYDNDEHAIGFSKKRLEGFLGEIFPGKRGQAGP